MNLRELIPKDSVLQLWMGVLSATEVPLSFQIATGLSTIGCVARRSFYYDQVNWKVYPALRILLVGPSGIGKDTSIDRATEAIQATSIPIIGGRTYEYISGELSKLAPPAVCYIPAPEISAFIGKSSYQDSMVQRVTDLLSDKDLLNISTKGSPDSFIYKPTVTLMAGSTKEWLQSAMPEGSLEGGFFPRFLIVPEEYTDKHIPLVKHTLTVQEVSKVKKAKADFHTWIKDFSIEAVKAYENSGGISIVIRKDAIEMYENWYYNRRKFFADTVRAYAERSRDQVLRLAFLLSLSRGRTYVDADDMHFAITLMIEAGRKIAEVVIPPSREGKCMMDIMSIMPNSYGKVLMLLAPKYTRRVVTEALRTLVEAGEIIKDGTNFESRKAG